MFSDFLSGPGLGDVFHLSKLICSAFTFPYRLPFISNGVGMLIMISLVAFVAAMSTFSLPSQYVTVSIVLRNLLVLVCV